MTMINEFISFIIFELCYLGLLLYIFYITGNLSFFKYLLSNKSKKANKHTKKWKLYFLNKLKEGD